MTSPPPATQASPADGTRGRIVTAAVEEFARHGIAGARVDRIAREARTSKERVYAHFRSKHDLYAQTVAQELELVARATHLEPGDLPGYAGRLYEHFADHPHHFRLLSWGRLELGVTVEGVEDVATDTAIRGKLDQLTRAQRAGVLDASWDPVDILAIVNQIATTWAAQPELTAAASSDSASRRAAVERAVQRIFPRTTRPD